MSIEVINKDTERDNVIEKKGRFINRWEIQKNYYMECIRLEADSPRPLGKV